MEFLKINYDDFYKFLMSLGTIILMGSGVGIFILRSQVSNMWWGSIFIPIIIISILIMIWAGKKWYKNQQNIDRKIAAETTLIEREASQIVGPRPKSEVSQIFKREKKGIKNKAKKEDKVALVTSKIASALPNSISFNFLKEFKVWFWIANHDPKKYRAYIRIKFITDELAKELTAGYYGGTQAWNLNAFTGIQAPGLGIPEEIKDVARKGKIVKIQINCDVKDENDNLIEKKFPQTYIYDPGNNNWFLEP